MLIGAQFRVATTVVICLTACTPPTRTTNRASSTLAPEAATGPAATSVDPTPAPWAEALNDPALNLQFEVAEPSQADRPADWHVSGTAAEVALDEQVRHDGARSLRLHGGAETRVFAAQRINAEPLVNTQVTLKAFVRREGATTGKLVLWLRVEAANGDVLRVFNSPDSGLTGVGNWVEAEATLQVPPGARWIHFGPMLRGEGDAWVDSLALVASALPAPSHITQDVRVSGIDGAPLEGAWVTALGAGGATVVDVRRTDAKGQVSFTLETGASVAFSAHHPDGLAAFSGASQVRGGQVVDLHLGDALGVMVDVAVEGLADGGAIAAGDFLVVHRYSDDVGDAFAVPLKAGEHLRARLPASDRGFLATVESSSMASTPASIGKDGGAVTVSVEPYREPSPAVIDWVASHHVALRGSDPGLALDDLVPLLPMLGKARVIAVGEATHGTREFSQMKHRLLQLMVERGGLRLFVLEDEDTLCRAIDAYVLGGPGDPHVLLAQLFPVWQTEEMIALIEWLRTWNASHADKVRFVGVDIQDIAGVEAPLRDFLVRAGESDPDRWLTPLYEVIRSYPGIRPDIQDEAARARTQRALDELAMLFRKRNKVWTKRLGRAAVAGARHDLRLVEQAFRMSLTRAGILAESADGDRDSAMAENTEWYVNQAGRGARALVWAHSGHIAFDDQGGKGMGWYLRRSFGRDYVAIDQEFAQGGFQAVDGASIPYTRAMREYIVGPLGRGALSAGFAKAPGIVVVDLRHLPAGEVRDWFASPHATRWVGFAFSGSPDETSSMVFTDRFDMLVHVERATRARPVMLGSPRRPLMRKPDRASPDPESPRSAR